MNPDSGFKENDIVKNQKEALPPRSRIRRLLVLILFFCIGENALRISTIVFRSDKAESGDVMFKAIAIFLAIGGLLLIVMTSIIAVAWGTVLGLRLTRSVIGNALRLCGGSSCRHFSKTNIDKGDRER